MSTDTTEAGSGVHMVAMILVGVFLAWYGVFSEDLSTIDRCAFCVPLVISFGASALKACKVVGETVAVAAGPIALYGLIGWFMITKLFVPLLGF